MKLKLIALFLTLTLTSWAQTATSTPEQKSAPADTKMACSCCDKMASADQKTTDPKATDQKEAHACMHQSAAGKDDKTTMSCCSGKDNAGCCAGKDGKSCAKNDQAASSCCEGMKKGEGQEMPCCSDKDGKEMTHDCCGGNQCGKHDHAAGN
jgi:hypothetical protein